MMSEVRSSLTIRIQVSGLSNVFVSLPVAAETGLRWVPNDDFLGLENEPVGVLDPGGAPGHEVLSVFRCRLTERYMIGSGSFNLADEARGVREQVAYVELIRKAGGPYPLSLVDYAQPTLSGS
jgi:hypothetical protein